MGGRRGNRVSGSKTKSLRFPFFVFSISDIPAEGSSNGNFKRGTQWRMHNTLGGGLVDFPVDFPRKREGGGKEKNAGCDSLARARATS